MLTRPHGCHKLVYTDSSMCRGIFRSAERLGGKQMRNVALLIGIVLLVCSAGCSRGSSELAKLQRQAAEGDVIAQYNLGCVYAEGDGVQKDAVKAAKWFLKAAESGDVDAQYMLAVMYDDGEGVEEDDTAAVKWYLEAAKQGDQFSQYNLAVMYDDGTGVEQDYVKAMHWYRQAAEQGDIDGQFSIGIMYQLGEGVRADQAIAHAWFSLAADNGHADAEEKCLLLQEQLSEEELSKAKALQSELAERYGR